MPSPFLYTLSIHSHIPQSEALTDAEFGVRNLRDMRPPIVLCAPTHFRIWFDDKYTYYPGRPTLDTEFRCLGGNTSTIPIRNSMVQGERPPNLRVQRSAVNQPSRLGGRMSVDLVSSQRRGSRLRAPGCGESLPEKSSSCATGKDLTRPSVSSRFRMGAAVMRGTNFGFDMRSNRIFPTTLWHSRKYEMNGASPSADRRTWRRHFRTDCAKAKLHMAIQATSKNPTSLNRFLTSVGSSS